MEIWNSGQRGYLQRDAPMALVWLTVAPTMRLHATGVQCRLFGWIVFILFIQFLIGCDDRSNQQEQKVTMNTDIVKLRRFINLPAQVNSCEWQTGEFAPGGDWWLAATLNIDAGDISKFLQAPPKKERIEIPPALKLDSSFSALASYPNAVASESKGLSFIAEVYPVTPYESSPLLNGKAIKLSENIVFILLWTL